MKSRKLKAVLAAVSALAVLATAMTGFAAIDTTTTTIYNTADAGKGTVEVDVTGLTPDSEVTYLVKSEGAGVNDTGIVYIDQATADENGAAEFNYKIAHSAINSAYGTVITMGSDTDEMTGYDTTLGITALNDVTEGQNYTIVYTEDAYADDDEVNVAIAPATGYVIKSITFDGVAQDVNQTAFTVDPTAVILVETELAEQEPGIAEEVTVVENTGFVDTNLNLGGQDMTEYSDRPVKTSLIKISGTPDEVGVYVPGIARFKAQRGDSEYVAVVVIGESGKELTTIPYYAVDGKAYTPAGEYIDTVE